MNGAESLLRTLAACGVEVCFTNPGTSEMHFVAALDAVPEVRGVLGLHENVATGAADGYARMTGRPAATLLHLGPGLGNGLANLHNARRARSPIVNIVGDHALYHGRYDAPLESDIDTIARNVSGWLRRTRSTPRVGADAADAVAAAAHPPGQVATLVLPADVSWAEGGVVAAARPVASPVPVTDETVASVAAVLRSGEPAVLFLGGRALRGEPLRTLGRIARSTGAHLLSETFPSRHERGAGLPPVDRLAYFGEMALAQLTPYRHVVLVDAASPVSFFGYPNKPSDLVPEGCTVHVLAHGSDDVAQAVAALADAVGAGPDPLAQPPARPGPPSGPLTLEAVGAAVGALLPEGAIVSDEAITSGFFIPGATAGAPPHDWLTLTGGAIGQGMPVSTGAAVACPGRKVVSLQADGSALYTVQSLWTQAREGLDVVTVLFDNRQYAVLNLELDRVGARTGGRRARDLFDLSRPAIDFVALAEGFGVPASRPDTADDFVRALEAALGSPGPHLIDVVVPT